MAQQFRHGHGHGRHDAAPNARGSKDDHRDDERGGRGRYQRGRQEEMRTLEDEYRSWRVERLKTSGEEPLD